ncbi:putative holin-like toxin [Paenibacillus sedimenti]|uniref:Holin-like toxin n=1 Tax=Paenibacillus sedimenti TaxID=2770274 RepID=A0A926KXG7_9BACL|nr:putative holin-like toxin [Paenibacillus sedimenti]MBD0384038.1 hypothetical protein [Paenibacillus sedimenti]
MKHQEPQELLKLLLQFGSFLLALLTFIALIVVKIPNKSTYRRQTVR